ncbi:MAG: DUF1800 domain-containing protein [Actinobacteria bacterium]|nr:DUF1800 domain-containing protein [Actinomycetota bacterium]
MWLDDPLAMSTARTRRRAEVAHVYRRLSMGPQPDLVADTRTADDAIARALDLATPAATPPAIAPPVDDEAARQAGQIGTPIAWWVDQMQQSPRLIEERLVWFWHDHFATGLQKVRYPYLMWQQHLTLRRNATGSFATMLKEISRDPAMLLYLDGITNTARERNENFGREVMELFTLGHGHYTEQDVVEASRAFTGWVVNIPGRPVARLLSNPAWTSAFVPSRFDAGTKTLLGTTGALDMDGALDVLLARDATSERIAAKLYGTLVGTRPSDKTVRRLGKVLRDADYEVVPLVEAIVADGGFLAAEARNVRARSPLEKLVGLIQAVPPTGTVVGRVGPRGQSPGAGNALRTLGYVPFVPPNVAGFPDGSALLGPHQMVHAFDLLSVYPTAPTVPATVDGLLDRLALVDVSDRTRTVLRDEPDPARRLALAVTAPEYSVM